MPRYRHERHEIISVYALCDDEKKVAFIWKALERNLHRTYSDHVCLRNIKTEEMVGGLKAENKKPSMYVLETLETTHHSAYNNCVAWVKYFRDYGYEILPMKGIEKFSLDLYGSQIEIFDSIKDIPFGAICSPEKNLFPDHGDKSKKNREDNVEQDRRVTIRFSEEDYAAIKAAAQREHMTIAAFSRERILKGRTVHIDFEFANQFFHELMEDREILLQILLSIYTRCEYDSVDLENIQRLANDLHKNAMEFDKAFRAQVRKLNRKCFD